MGERQRQSDVIASIERSVTAIGRLLADFEPSIEGDRIEFRVLGSVFDSMEDHPLASFMREQKVRFADQWPIANWVAEVSVSKLADLAEERDGAPYLAPTWVSGENFIEMLIRDETPIRSIRGRRYKNPLIHAWPSPEGEVEVLVGPASPSLILRMLKGFDENSLSYLEERDFWLDATRIYGWLRNQESKQEFTIEEHARVSAIRLLKVAATENLISLRVESKKPIGIENMREIASRFRASAAYEASVVYEPVDRLRDSVRRRPPAFFRGLDADAAEASKGVFRLPGEVLRYSPVSVDTEHAERYLRGVSAADTFTAFMSFYHLIEFSFKSTWIRFCQRQVEDAGLTWTCPSSDAKVASREAERNLGLRRDSLKFTERGALKQVLHQSVNLAEILADLNSLLPGSADYFATRQPPFASVPTVDFTGDGNDIVESLTNRIYGVRCAITHSKEGEDRYTPYLHDEDLGKEVPLVRLVAEQILFSI